MNISNSLKGAIAIIVMVFGGLYFGKQNYDRAERMYNEATQKAPSSPEVATPASPIDAIIHLTIESGVPGRACAYNDAVNLQEIIACTEDRIVASSLIDKRFGIELHDGKATLWQGPLQIGEADCTDPTTVFRICAIPARTQLAQGPERQ